MSVNASRQVKVLVISGSMGSGKTTVMGEASDILSARSIPHAAVDLDALGVACIDDVVAEELTTRNLAAVWGNYSNAGVKRLLIAEALESAAQLERLHAAVPGAEIVVCRLKGKVETMQARIRVREPGLLQERFVARAAMLEATLDAARVEDFCVDNDDRIITEVAREVLVRAGWIDEP